MSDFLKQFAFKGTDHVADAPILELDGISVAYAPLSNSFNGATYALERVSCHVETGEHLAIIGPNGAGKSTLLKVAAGILKPDQGAVRLFGQAPDRHICVAYVPQRNQIDWRFPVTVNDVVMMGRIRQIGLFRRPSGRDHQIVRQSLARVGAEQLADKQIGELSGGQQQRIFIARALAQRADLLLLDEPLSGLDIPSQKTLLDILAALKPDGVTVLVATHDLNLAAERFDRVMLLNQQIIALGPPDQVLNNANLLAAYGGQIKLDGPRVAK